MKINPWTLRREAMHWRERAAWVCVRLGMRPCDASDLFGLTGVWQRNAA